MQLTYLRNKKAWNSGLNGIQPITIRIPMQCATNWAIKPTGGWSVYKLVINPWRMDKQRNKSTNTVHYLDKNTTFRRHPKSWKNLLKQEKKLSSFPTVLRRTWNIPTSNVFQAIQQVTNEHEDENKLQYEQGWSFCNFFPQRSALSTYGSCRSMWHGKHTPLTEIQHGRAIKTCLCTSAIWILLLTLFSTFWLGNQKIGWKFNDTPKQFKYFDKDLC